jgi:hypothetical protein
MKKVHTCAAHLGLHEGRPNYSINLRPSKENIQHSKHEISLLFTPVLFLFVIFSPEPRSAFPTRILIRVQSTKIIADPDPKTAKKCFMVRFGPVYTWVSRTGKPNSKGAKKTTEKVNS